jgi:hypothetical protein
MRIIKSVIFAIVALAFTGCNKKTVPSTGNRELDRIIAKIEKGQQPTAQEQQVINEAILDGNSALLKTIPQEGRASMQEFQKTIAAHPELKSQILNHLRG